MGEQHLGLSIERQMPSVFGNQDRAEYPDCDPFGENSSPLSEANLVVREDSPISTSDFRLCAMK
jgi:hypothetical protein